MQIQESGRLLLNLINDILYMTKLDLEKIDVAEIPFDMRLLIDEVCDELSTMAEKNNLDIKVEYPEEAPGTLIGDAAHIKKVLMNLVSNSLKFTTEGYVKISVECENLNGKGALLRVSVEDTGIGFSEEMADIIFDKFTQADSSATRTFQGAGLGLAISKKLVELMGGVIGCKSEPGNGSTFFFKLRLPLNQPTEKVAV